MKTPILPLLGLMLISLPPQLAHAAELKNLKKCSQLSNLKPIQDADEKEHQAEADLNAALAAVKTYDGTCQQYAAGNIGSQDSAVIARLASQGRDASGKSSTARASTQAAIQAMSKALNPVNSLGGRECAQELHDDIGELKKYMAQLEASSQRLTNCVKNGTAGAESSGSGGGNSGISGSEKPAPGLGGAR